MIRSFTSSRLEYDIREDLRRDDGDGGEGDASRSVEKRLRITFAGELFDAAVRAVAEGREGSFGSELAGGVETGEAMIVEQKCCTVWTGMLCRGRQMR